MNISPLDQFLFAGNEDTFESYYPTTDQQEQAKKSLLDLANEIIACKDRDRVWELFRGGKLIVLSGSPGTGKTHLLRSFVRKIVAERPEFSELFYVEFGNMAGAQISQDDTINSISWRSFPRGNYPIGVIDDAFFDVSNIDRLDGIAIGNIVKLISTCLDNSRLCIMNSNFSFANGIEQVIAKNDPTGRISSRLYAILAGGINEFDMTGEDQRKVIADFNNALRGLNCSVCERTTIGNPKPDRTLFEP